MRSNLTNPAAWLLPLIVLLGAGCEKPSGAGSIRHPTKENTPSEGDLADVIRREARASSELQALAARLANARLVMTVGELEGAPETVFGAIEDVDVHAPGRFAVLDSRYNEVRVFDSSGAFVERFGRPGAGRTSSCRPRHWRAAGRTASSSRTGMRR